MLGYKVEPCGRPDSIPLLAKEKLDIVIEGIKLAEAWDIECEMLAGKTTGNMLKPVKENMFC